MFLDRKDIEIWVHDLELRSAFWSVATGADVGVYLKHYLKLDLYAVLQDRACRCADLWQQLEDIRRTNFGLLPASLAVHQPLHSPRLTAYRGITLHHLPGHTDGLIGMQINMRESGTFLFISDHCHVIENVSYPPSSPPSHLPRVLLITSTVARWYPARLARS